MKHGTRAAYNDTKCRCNVCKESNNSYMRKYRRGGTNPKVKYIREAKDKPCMDCGVSYPHYVMEYDHRDSSTKLFMLSQYRYYDLELIRAEIDKCDLVCSNCHAIRTYSRYQSSS